MKIEKTQTPVALFRFEVTTYGFVHPHITFVTIQDGSPRMLDSDQPLAGLDVTGQGNSDSREHDIYAFSATFTHGAGVTLSMAERMVKTLRKLEASLSKQQDELGYPQDWPEYARRVIAAFGVKEVWFYRDNDNIRSTFSQNNYHVEYKLGDAAYRMRRVIEKWAEDKAA